MEKFGHFNQEKKLRVKLSSGRPYNHLHLDVARSVLGYVAILHNRIDIPSNSNRERYLAADLADKPVMGTWTMQLVQKCCHINPSHNSGDFDGFKLKCQICHCRCTGTIGRCQVAVASFVGIFMNVVIKLQLTDSAVLAMQNAIDRWNARYAHTSALAICRWILGPICRLSWRQIVPLAFWQAQPPNGDEARQASPAYWLSKNKRWASLASDLK